MAQPIAPRPVVLCVLDGWGHRLDPRDNAVLAARTPNFDRLVSTCPQGLIDASELYVGLPQGQMGNSEVGHMNLGAGRVVMQDLPRIDRAIADGSLAKGPALQDFIAKLKASGGACHVMGLVSPGGVHSHQDHIAALANIVAAAGVHVRVHAFLDGRDTPPQSAREYLADLQAALKPGLPITIGTVSGRFYAMDRDKRWDRVTKAYVALTDAQGERADTPDAAVAQGYAAKTTDEFVLPTVIAGYDGMKDGDGVLMGNFRADRAREILTALLDPLFDGFPRPRVVSFAGALGLTEYSTALNAFLDTLFPSIAIANGLGETVSKAGLTQLRIAETEKYAHVTFFLNGGEERVFPGEDRILVPSPKVATYDLKPEMSAPEVTDRLVEAIDAKRFDLIVVNYANTDQVGHSGVFAAAVKAVETVDSSLGRLMDAVQRAGGTLLVTADHGNVEQLFDYETNQPHTQHTLNKVPAVLFNAPAGVVSLADGRLADVAPTLLALMGIKQPAEMTGQSLLRATPRDHVLTVPAAMRQEAARKVA
ncbi:2,3-bisphosphoglycerate-independent phosphoglycerate mutase [Vineibacter terrae]|uniref:2,3-bisphosphoglycerate-independent phosphoglycerate mutase n=1 Tax=Vineibacter terrae TaxID=2586908 RepID=A0A5C8PFJ0_9HYPH|nr:2,3-bisphosphoglycerate-independent phosphoglycerate mutase [Vineibacter terrae]TXL72110.1 2,3-bisphosphoglycerate-independent phosphoglycerate mutase [Vineibacter terrae]